MVYTADDIQVITWPGPIRKRPECFFKCLGTQGCLWLLEEVLTTILDKKYHCCASLVNLRLNRHGEVIIEYNGLGLPVETTQEPDVTQPLLYGTLMTLPYTPDSEADYKKHGHLFGIGGIFNVACKHLFIKTVRQGISYGMSWSEGCISSLLTEWTRENAGLNSLRFLFDTDVFGNFELQPEHLKNLVDLMEKRYEGVTVTYGSSGAEGRRLG